MELSLPFLEESADHDALGLHWWKRRQWTSSFLLPVEPFARTVLLVPAAQRGKASEIKAYGPSNPVNLSPEKDVGAVASG